MIQGLTGNYSTLPEEKLHGYDSLCTYLTLANETNDDLSLQGL